jgi:hypothetical protein
MMDVVPAFDNAAKIAAALELHQIPYAIGGAIAWGAWADPRGTHDVDINLFVTAAELDRALDVLETVGVAFVREQAMRAEAEGDVIIGWLNNMRVDLFTPSIPFAWEALKTRRRLTGPSGDAYYLSPEAIALFKLLFFRPKDLLDVEKLILVQGKDLDVFYIRRWLVDMMGQDDERVLSFDAMCSRANP